MAQERLTEQEENQEENTENGAGNIGLPFGLCKKYGIYLPNNATPREAWDALKKRTGLSPNDFYRELKQREQRKRDKLKKIYDDDGGQDLVFVSANTTQQAENYAKTTLGISNVDYKGIDIEVANEMNDAIRRGINICPQIRDKIKSVGNAQRVNKAFREEYAAAKEQYLREIYPGLPDESYKRLGKQYANKKVAKIPSNAIAFARTGGDVNSKLDAIVKKYEGIVANEKLCNNAKRLKEQLEFNKKTGFLSVGTLAGTFDHEVAHQIDFALGLSKNADMVALYRSMSTQEIANGLSRYGASSISEFIAEGWAEYCNSDSPRPIAKQIGEIIKRET